MKKNGSYTSSWWMRSANFRDNKSFIGNTGGRYTVGVGLNTYGVSPAFRIG